MKSFAPPTRTRQVVSGSVRPSSSIPHSYPHPPSHSSLSGSLADLWLGRVGNDSLTVFNSCVNELEQGKRLENLSWRTWSRERTLYSRFSRVPILDDEPDSRSPALTEDEDDGDGDSSRDSSGSDDGSDDDQSRQERQQQQQNTNHLAPVPSETVVPPDVAEVAVAVTVTPAAAVTPAAVPPFVVATAAQSTTGEQQQHPPLVATSNTSSNQSRQQHHNHHPHQGSASHPATASHPKLLANPPSRRHYSHSLPYTAAAAAAAAAAASASASPPIGQLIKRVIFNQSATMLTMTHSIGTSSSLGPSVRIRALPLPPPPPPFFLVILCFARSAATRLLAS